jgi:hypothetical protein
LPIERTAVIPARRGIKRRKKFLRFSKEHSH